MIRAATIDDALRIAEIQVASWRAIYQGLIPKSYLRALNVERREELWRKLAGNPLSPLLLACEGPRVIGFCHVCATRDDDVKNAAEITSIYLDPQDWQRGHGRALCNAALRFARKRGFECVTLWVLVGNTSAQSFYEAMGFRPDGASKREDTGDFTLNEIRYHIDLGLESASPT